MKRWFIILTVSMLLFSFFACATEQAPDPLDDMTDVPTDETSADTGLRRTVIYLGCDEGYIVPVMRMIPWEEGIGKAALSCLIDSGSNSTALALQGLIAPIPEGAQISLRIAEDGSATVDIGGIGDFESAEEEIMMVTAVVNTLLEFPTINNVSMYVNGKADDLKNGTVLPKNSMYIPLNVMLDDTETLSGDGYSAHEVYFTNGGGSINIPITIYGKQGMGFRDAVEIMVNGVDLPGIRCCFPEGTRLIDARIEGSTAVVNLSSEFLEMEHYDGLALAAYETLFLTASSFEAISELILMVDGANYFSDDTVLPMPVFVNEFGY